ncbi:LysR substrate-binding domain-containing protein [Vreelandella titanicae]|nr:LysR substrate-binding domain-containing protein [Halomonas titanicae]
MNMRQLQYFLAVAQELNFTRAAERVNIAQPPLSQQIIALEEELGTPLFTREKRKVKLTPAGAVLVEHAKRVLNAAEAAVAAVRAGDRGAQATLTVGAIYSSIYSFLPATLRIFNTIVPNTEVSLQEMTISQQITALKEGIIEVGLVRGRIHDRDIATELLYRELFVVAVPEGSQYDQVGEVTIEELSYCPLIAVSRGTASGYSDRILDLFEDDDLQPRIVNEVKDMHTSVCLVSAGMGVSIVPAIMQLMQSQGVVYRPLRVRKGTGASFSLAWRKNNESPQLESFFEAARANANELMSNHPQLFLHKVGK